MITALPQINEENESLPSRCFRFFHKQLTNN
jgi:hypothetical protein